MSFVVDESIYANYFYHIRKQNEKNALCSASTLGKELPFRLFGYKSPHINEKYCIECKKIYTDMNK